MVLATALAVLARVVDQIWGTTRWFGAASRVVPGFVATMVAAAIVTTAPVFAQTHTPIAPIGHLRDGRAPTTVLTAPIAPAPVVAPPPPGGAPGEATGVAPDMVVHVVRDGESLWSIARERVGSDPTVLGDYWRVVCDANRAALASGDANLIHPGEAILLPPRSGIAR
jgi:nucleoid-associated protein YgaU